MIVESRYYNLFLIAPGCGSTKPELLDLPSWCPDFTEVDCVRRAQFFRLFGIGRAKALRLNTGAPSRDEDDEEDGDHWRSIFRTDEPRAIYLKGFLAGAFEGGSEARERLADLVSGDVEDTMYVEPTLKTPKRARDGDVIVACWLCCPLVLRKDLSSPKEAISFRRWLHSNRTCRCT